MEITKEMLDTATQAANYEQLRVMYDALAAELVAVKAAADKMRFKGAIISNICYNIGQSHSDAEQILQAVKEYDEESRKFRDASSLSPQHHLRQVRADAVSKFAEHVFTGNDCLHINLKAYANQYAASILAGKE